MLDPPLGPGVRAASQETGSGPGMKKWFYFLPPLLASPASPALSSLLSSSIFRFNKGFLRGLVLGGFFPNTAQIGGAGGVAHVSISKEEKPVVGENALPGVAIKLQLPFRSERALYRHPASRN